jgi:SnoaL-like polyketide cyclase
MKEAISIEKNKLLAKKFLHLVSEGNLDGICEIISPDWRMHIGLGKAEIPQGPEGMKKLFETFGRIEQTWSINDVIAERDKVVVRATNNCLQENFFGIPSFGRSQIFTATFIHRIEDGKIQETWRNADDLGRVLQLGAKIQPDDPEESSLPDTRFNTKMSWKKYIFYAFWWKRSY